jgi:hypothetical protein
MAGVLAAKVSASGWAKCCPSRETDTSTAPQTMGNLRAVKCKLHSPPNATIQSGPTLPLGYRKSFMGWEAKGDVVTKDKRRQRQAVIVCVQAEETEASSRDLAGKQALLGNLIAEWFFVILL